MSFWDTAWAEIEAFALKAEATVVADLKKAVPVIEADTTAILNAIATVVAKDVSTKTWDQIVTDVVNVLGQNGKGAAIDVLQAVLNGFLASIAIKPAAQ